MLSQAIDFTGNSELYGAAMLRVIKEWRYSCEHNLSNTTQNRRAWLGHAACALERGFCEDVVRSAWHRLTNEQREAADAQAEAAIREWEKCQKQGLE